MSVRRNPARAARRGSNDALGVVKGTLFWGSLLAGSFLFGMLVISPIYYQWRGGPSASISANPSPQSQPPTIQAPAASTTRESDRYKPRPQRRVPEPEISVSAEPNRSEVQRADSLDESKSAKRRATEDLNGGITTDDQQSDQTANERRKAAPQEDLIQPDNMNPESARPADTETTQPSESRRSRRARKSAESGKTEAAASKRHSPKPAGEETKTKDSGSKPGVQKGETID